MGLAKANLTFDLVSIRMHQDPQSPTAKPRIRVYLTLIFASIVLTACPPKTPSQSQIVDSRIAALTASELIYKADALANNQRAGQWLQYKSVDEYGEPTLLTYKLISSDGFNHSIEVVEEDYHGSFASYIELRYDPGRDVENLEVKRVLTRHGEGAPKESSSEDLAVKKPYYRALASQLFTPWNQGVLDGDIVVGAGQFQGCLKLEMALTIVGLSFRANTWHHPFLPLNGMVRAERTDGTKGTIELVDFGLDGAHSLVLDAVR